ncbi:hypothetical protein lerEdw1_011504 [Lerista edwardsae]|nr:hypothetical protein lerEdw1_011504 [Lerista edwardsae]
MTLPQPRGRLAPCLALPWDGTLAGVDSRGWAETAPLWSWGDEWQEGVSPCRAKMGAASGIGALLVVMVVLGVFPPELQSWEPPALLS